MYLPNTDDALYLAVKRVQAFDDANPAETASYIAAMMDGLESSETFDIVKLSALCQK
jgi:hypothetical protein